MHVRHRACAAVRITERKLWSLGHTVQLMATQFVKPYVKTNMNNAADVEAICEAVARATMRFVSIKNLEQQWFLRYTACVRASSRRTPHRPTRQAVCSENSATDLYDFNIAVRTKLKNTPRRKSIIDRLLDPSVF